MSEPRLKPELGYATRLATAIWERWYKTAAPDWKPSPDLLGVLTQIDNMSSGLVRAQPEPAAHPELPALPESMPLRAWLVEREENAVRIAGGKNGNDRDGWLEDAAYFRAAYLAVDAIAARQVEPVGSILPALTAALVTEFFDALPLDRYERIKVLMREYAHAALGLHAARLQAELAAPPAQADAADAMRYRWLRDAGMDQRNRVEHYAGPALDAAIDAAMSTLPAQESGDSIG